MSETRLELSPPRGITRHDYGRARGWLARHYRSGMRRLFSDGVYGGEELALQAAVAWLTELRETVPPPTRKRRPGYGYVRRGQRSYRTSDGQLRFYDAYVAHLWDQEGKPLSTSWSITEHGDEGAKARCDAWLEQARAELGLCPPSSLRPTEPLLLQAG